MSPDRYTIGPSIWENAYAPDTQARAYFAARAFMATMNTICRRRSVLSSTADAGITRYLQLYSILSQSLADGEFKASRALPSEPDLVARYRVSRTTVRRALLLLEQEGRILRRRGSGTYAKTNRVHPSLGFDGGSEER